MTVGMVVFCAGTSGYNITFDARYAWMRQKRIQGSHFAHLLETLEDVVEAALWKAQPRLS